MSNKDVLQRIEEELDDLQLKCLKLERVLYETGPAPTLDTIQRYFMGKQHEYMRKYHDILTLRHQRLKEKEDE